MILQRKAANSGLDTATNIAAAPATKNVRTLSEHFPNTVRTLSEHCPNTVRTLSEHCPNTFRTLSEHSVSRREMRLNPNFEPWNWEINPLTPKSDQLQISPAASPAILHHTEWRTWFFTPYSGGKWFRYQILTTSLIHLSLKGWENALFELGNERVLTLSFHFHSFISLPFQFFKKKKNKSRSVLVGDLASHRHRNYQP